MKVWLIWVQGDETTWLEAAWDDESIADNRVDYDAEIDRIQKMCVDNRYEMRIQPVNVPGVFELFEFITVDAEPAS